MFLIPQAITIALLALTLLASAFPLTEETSLQKRVAPQQPIAALAPVANGKTLTWSGIAFKAESYRARTNVAPWVSLTTSVVLDKWKSDTKRIHGPYISLPGKSQLSNQWTGQEDILILEGKYHFVRYLKYTATFSSADHVFEAQTVGKFMGWLEKESLKKYDPTVLADIFLANHDPGYVSNQGTQLSAERKKLVDYTKNKYKGSLLQHMMHELGTMDNPDRLALLSQFTNGRKGKVWKQEDVGNKNSPAEVA